MKARIYLFSVIATFATLHTAYAYVSDDEIKAKRLALEIRACESSLPSLRAEYDKLIIERKFWRAAGKLRFCASILSNRADLNALIADAEIKEHLSACSGCATGMSFRASPC